MHSIIFSGLIAGGKDTKEGRQAAFFTAEDLMIDFQEEDHDVSKPRKVHTKPSGIALHLITFNQVSLLGKF